MRFPQFIAVTWLALICVLAPAYAEKRVALVIGNERYANLPASNQLQKAVNDAHAVGKALTQIGFDVISGENLGKQALLARLDEAAQRLTPGDMVFFLFSGHGVAVDGFNYILPVDVPAVGSGQIASLTGAAVKEEDVTDRFLRAGARVAVVVLDACRNNPFASSGTKGIGGEKGLAPHEPPSGVFAFYAASRGESALDRLYDSDQNPNSVFTRVLVPALSRPDLDLPALAREVREEVTRLARSVNHIQRPAYYDETSGDRFFLAGVGTGRPGRAAPPSGTVSTPSVPIGRQQVAVVAPPVAPAMPAADPCSGPVTASFPSRCAAPLAATQERGLKPKDIFRECDSCPEMVVVPAGSFTMGSPASEKDRNSNEGPQHVVTIGRPFAVGTLHVTVDQFTAFVGDTGYVASSKCGIFEDGKSRESTGHSWRTPGFEQEGLHPVVCVSLDDAKAYVDWLAKKTGKSYRLPSEAEWEYAARGGVSPGAYPRFWFGDDEKDLCRYGNGADQKTRDNVAGAARWTIAPCNDSYAYTSPGGHFTPNAFGLYDMFGNAGQLTADCPHDNYNGAPADGTAWTTGCGNRSDWGVVRGGSWNYGPWSLRAASRQMWGLNPLVGVGFRVARTLTPAFQQIIQNTLSEPKPTFDVHPNFKSVYDAFASELGRPRGPAKVSDDAYQAEYDGAHIIWIKPLLTIYYLPDNNDERKVTPQPDTAWAPPELFDDSKLRPLFATPDDKLPPHGGVAYHWLKEPDRWKWIGWRRWYCRFFEKIFYQEFDSGVILGPFHASPTRDEGQIFTILNNGRWVARQARVNAPDCLQVAGPFPTRTR